MQVQTDIEFDQLRFQSPLSPKKLYEAFRKTTSKMARLDDNNSEIILEKSQ